MEVTKYVGCGAYHLCNSGIKCGLKWSLVQTHHWHELLSGSGSRVDQKSSSLYLISPAHCGHSLSLLFSTLLFLLDLTLFSPCHTLTTCIDIDCEPFDRFVGGCSVWTRVRDRLPAATARPRGDAQADGQWQQRVVSWTFLLFSPKMIYLILYLSVLFTWS